ncbi:elongation factor P--(R)-beta-lysine ligase [Candidatus Palibaumannia cicadellinicola]|uniref:Translation elongation factor P Lys34:lysine transferase n=1 Tax=Candidatus Palibaumannia cicadellinicola TaxID=186490 RepID=A0A0K2BLB7_9GAMM|nr:elongation factor P--(R)-beta-lysine ligase [Candidatus Baumannia cicadellinicola]AKZ66115.1 Translation elongation factor P Lys34:lysine transferase [Candidatus Baumannia cicadellinicola]
MNSLVSWQPSASILNLFKRAQILSKIRMFFNDLGLLEVDTPSMSKATIPEIHLCPFKTDFISPNTITEQGDSLPLPSIIPMYLITSPEYHMKRLLAAGSGPIFQICRSFRNKEFGSYHNPEFTILEWYRLDYDMYQIMNEVNDLLKMFIDYSCVEIISYKEIFSQYIGIDPLSIDQEKLYKYVVKFNLCDVVSPNDDLDIQLQLLFNMVIVPKMSSDKLIFVYHFPASQALMAEINYKDNRVSDRFEVYFQGIELANGFLELTDADKQRDRLKQENNKRTAINLKKRPIDYQLLAALEYGLPTCSGVALGVDRLLMFALKVKNIREVIAFSVTCA